MMRKFQNIIKLSHLDFSGFFSSLVTNSASATCAPSQMSAMDQMYKEHYGVDPLISYRLPDKLPICFPDVFDPYQEDEYVNENFIREHNQEFGCTHEYYHDAVFCNLPMMSKDEIFLIRYRMSLHSLRTLSENTTKNEA